jgi:hypothetical protein
VAIPEFHRAWLQAEICPRLGVCRLYSDAVFKDIECSAGIARLVLLANGSLLNAI